jgi:hypothetical protein
MMKYVVSFSQVARALVFDESIMMDPESLAVGQTSIARQEQSSPFSFKMRNSQCLPRG